MHKKILLLSTIGLLLSSCGVNPADQAIADEISQCAAIAQLSSGRDGVRVLFQDEENNTIYYPYMPPYGSNEKPIYKSSLLLSVWFKLEEVTEDVATLDWEFDNREYINFVAPANEKLPHATVSFPKFPEFGSTVEIHVKAKIKYKTATSEARYLITLDNTISH